MKTLKEMLADGHYPGMITGLKKVRVYPASAYNAPGKFCLYFKGSSTFGGKQRDTFAEAVEDANRANAEMDW